MQSLPTLHGRRLSLRQLETGDATSIVMLFGDPQVVAFMGIAQVEDANAARRFIDEVHELTVSDTLYQWGVVVDETDELVGTVTLFSFDERNARAELGFAIAREHWRKGYASEAVAIALDYAFSELALHRIEADADPDNTASLILLERIGFAREGYLPERWYVQGEWRDTVLFGLLARTWKET